ncbi:hypothetical protein D9M69_657600 [compost metagenome]
MQLYRPAGGHFYVLKSFVVKPGHEGFCSLPFQDINVGLERVTVIRGPVVRINIRHIRPPVIIKPFGMLQPNLRTLRARQADLADP